ncbi:MAG: DNA-directed RNA polymerase subunit beta' [Thermotogota bacterium]|nr:DNA-directed RNA polymerase subunit beta' [Thermotogota bacterium]
MAVNSYNRKINSVGIGIASSERVRSWSNGEVKKPETINYRTFKPEKDGLFCEKIFGPTKDYECACGKYKGKKYEGTVCERCNVKVESKDARRRKMGHIDLAAPVVHVWYLKSAPSILASILNVSSKDLENVIYYGSRRVIEGRYVVTDPKDTDFIPGQTLYQTEYEIYSKKWEFEVEQGVKVRNPKSPVVSDIDGKVEVESDTANTDREINWIIVKTEDGVTKKYPVFEGAFIYVNDGDEVRKGDTLADRFLFEDEVLSLTEYRLFDEYYPGSFEIETETESDRPIVLITEIDDEVSQEIGKNVGDIVIENEYEAYRELYPGKVRCDYGAAAIKKLLERLDFEELKVEIEHELKDLAKSSARALKLLRRLKFVKDFIKSDNKPEWIVMDVVPVVPPDLRPMIQIEGGRFATTDLNDLYRRVINRNNRLSKLLSIGAPEIIIRNEKRMLQEAVDSLIYNGRVGKAVTDKSGRPLKSLTDLVKGKKGRFRRNLLGKRVDYSGRAVIVVGPDLKIHECGIPKRMAMELFKPFVLGKLLGSESSKSARKLKKTVIEREMPEAWEVLEDVIKGHPVLLNRAPTLHRISIQSFVPRLVEGNAIKLHPLVCAPFNADFDGDQMAVHVPLSTAAQAEAKFLMLSRYNVISPANGKPISMPGKDIIVGVYYLTTTDYEYEKLENELNEYYEELKKSGIDENELKKKSREKALEKVNWKFGMTDEALMAYDSGMVGLHDPILVQIGGNEGLTLTSVGRIIFNSILPEKLRNYSQKFTKRQIKTLIYDCFQEFGIDRTADLLDGMMRMGFHYATVSGLTISIRDIIMYPRKEEIINEAQKKVEGIDQLYKDGYLNENNRIIEIIKIWEGAIQELTLKTYDEFKEYPFNPVYMMVDSGARGNIDQLKQLSGMRGLMADPSGKTIEVPILSNFRDGLKELEFFTSTHGARKGSADTALRTSFAGYLTRRLVDVAQSTTVTTPDCGTSEGIEAIELMADDVTIEKLEDFLFGRVLAEDIIDPMTGKTVKNPKTGKLYTRNTMIRDGDEVFLANFKRKVPVMSEEELSLDKKIHITDYTELAEEVTLEEKTYESGMQLTGDILHEMKEKGIKKLKVNVYPAVNKVYVGHEFRNKDNIQLVKYQEKLIPTTAKTLLKEGYESLEVRPSINIRTVLTCEAEQGVCAACYGMDLSNHDVVNVGEAVGIVAAQSIGEPGTQLTMRTFHTGGIATETDITRGLPRAEELFEARKKLKEPEALFSEVNGFVKDMDTDDKGRRKLFVETPEVKIKEYRLSSVIKPKVHIGDKVLEGESLTTGTVRPRKLMQKLGINQTAMYLLREIKRVYAEQGVEIHDKHFELIIKQMLSKVEITDPGDTELLPGTLINIQKVKKFNEQISRSNRKVEENKKMVIGRRLARKVLGEDEDEKVVSLGIEGEMIDKELTKKFEEYEIKEISIYDVEEEEYQKLLEEIDPDFTLPEKSVQISPKDYIKYKRRLLRITKASLESEGWLSAASFQQTPQVLTEASTEGKMDKLLGLKENVIVGQLIPAGTGLDMYSNIQIEEAGMAEEEEDIG